MARRPDPPALTRMLAHRAEVLALRSWLGGAAFADERGWLSEAESERLARASKAWPQTLLRLGEHVRRVRRTHNAAFLAWVDREIQACLHDTQRKQSTEAQRATARGYLARWRAVRERKSEDFSFGDFPRGPAPDPALALRALAGDPAAREAWAGAPAHWDLRETKRVLGLPRAAPSRWIQAGCPSLRDGQRSLLDPVAMLGWFDAAGFPGGTDPAAALMRLARRFAPTDTFLAVGALANEVEAFSERQVRLPATDGLRALGVVLDQADRALAEGEIPFADPADRRVELRWILADHLLARVGGTAPARSLAGPARWKIVASADPAGGGLYEWEQRFHWTVWDWRTRQISHRFHGDSDSSYTGAGDWGPTTWTGTQDVSLAPDGTALLVTDGQGAVTRQALPDGPISTEPPAAD